MVISYLALLRLRSVTAVVTLRVVVRGDIQQQLQAPQRDYLQDLTITLSSTACLRDTAAATRWFLWCNLFPETYTSQLRYGVKMFCIIYVYYSSVIFFFQFYGHRLQVRETQLTTVDNTIYSRTETAVSRHTAMGFFARKRKRSIIAITSEVCGGGGDDDEKKSKRGILYARRTTYSHSRREHTGRTSGRTYTHTHDGQRVDHRDGDETMTTRRWRRRRRSTWRARNKQ